MKLSDIIRQVNNDTTEIYSAQSICDWGNRILDELSILANKAFTYLDPNQLDVVPDLETPFHGLLVLGVTYLSQYQEEEPEKQMDAYNRYQQRKQDYIKYINRNRPTESIENVYEVGNE